MNDAHRLRDQARGAAARGDLDAAANALYAAAEYTHLSELDYAPIVQQLGEVLLRRGDERSALSVAYYFLRADPRVLAQAVGQYKRIPAGDRAHGLAALGHMAEAAREAESGQLLARAAIYREKAGDFAGARALWSRLGQSIRGRADAYVAALVQFNLARCARKCGDKTQARTATVASVRLLEEAADHFEAVGLRERAFDCFQVLVQIGKETQGFEDLLEGYVNCIRILREDHLKYFALQFYDEALKSSEQSGELSAAATLAKEAADYARSLGMSSAGLYYVMKQGELWQRQASKHQQRQAPPEIAENALLASVLAFGEVGQYARIGELYRSLSTLDLEPTRRAHYARASKRYDSLRDENLDAVPAGSQAKQDVGAPDVWHVDVLEWEQQGSAAETAAEVLLDLRWPDLIRRKALSARLTAFAAEREDVGTRTAQVRLAGQLAQLQLYSVLSPLEKLYEVPDVAVRSAVLAALRTLFFKRSFVTVRAALKDSSPVVVNEAATTTRALYFQHAFDPLARIVRESSSATARAAAITALSKIDTAESAEFLLGLIEHGPPPDQTATVDALRNARGTRFVELARTHLPSLQPDARNRVREVLKARGLAA